jgi:hypothetical protein
MAVIITPLAGKRIFLCIIFAPIIPFAKQYRSRRSFNGSDGQKSVQARTGAATKKGISRAMLRSLRCDADDREREREREREKELQQSRAVETSFDFLKPSSRLIGGGATRGAREKHRAPFQRGSLSGASPKGDSARDSLRARSYARGESQRRKEPRDGKGQQVTLYFRRETRR